MTPQEILTSFTAPLDGPADYLRKPWREGEHVYAANGHWMVRMPAESCEPADEITARHPRNVIAMFAKAPQEGFFPLIVSATPTPCECCTGAGTMYRGAKCPGCNGKGRFPHAGWTYACELCGHSGKVLLSQMGIEQERCTYCCGTGFQFGSERDPIRVGTQHFQDGYIHHLARLPGIEFANGGPDNWAAAFRFAHGEGMLMPLDPKKVAERFARMTPANAFLLGLLCVTVVVALFVASGEFRARRKRKADLQRLARKHQQRGVRAGSANATHFWPRA